jgi:hypothetical protein
MRLAISATAYGSRVFLSANHEQTLIAGTGALSKAPVRVTYAQRVPRRTPAASYFSVTLALELAAAPPVGVKVAVTVIWSLPLWPFRACFPAGKHHVALSGQGGRLQL